MVEKKKVCILHENVNRMIGYIEIECKLNDDIETTTLTLYLLADKDGYLIETLRDPFTELMDEPLSANWGEYIEKDGKGYRYRSIEFEENSFEYGYTKAERFITEIVKTLKEAIGYRRDRLEFIKKHEKEVIELYL